MASTLTPNYIKFSMQPKPSPAKPTSASSPTGRPLEFELPEGITDLCQLSKNAQRQIRNQAVHKRYEQTKRNLFPTNKWLARRASVLGEDTESISPAREFEHFVELEAEARQSPRVLNMQ